MKGMLSSEISYARNWTITTANGRSLLPFISSYVHLDLCVSLYTATRVVKPQFSRLFTSFQIFESRSYQLSHAI